MSVTLRRYNLVGMLAAVLLGLIVAACVGATPAPLLSDALPAPRAQEAPSTLQTVMDRGHVICIGNDTSPVFGLQAEDGSFAGFDIEFCRVLAAAIFGDAEKFAIRPADAPAERFAALAAGEGDVLIRTTTNTLSRDAEVGNFGPTLFYDGQGVMVRAADGLTSLADLDGGSVCVATGTTTELNLMDAMALRGIAYEHMALETDDDTLAAYASGQCDAYTTDKSTLVSSRALLADPAAHVILDPTLSKEPLGPLVRHGDDAWMDLVTWSVYVTFLAEEMGVTSANVDSLRDSADPSVRRLVDADGAFGPKLGLDSDWSYAIIKQVGNYAEIYARHMGPDTAFSIPRGLNGSWVDGGLLYAPPIR